MNLKILVTMFSVDVSFVITGNIPENVVFRNFSRSNPYSQERADYAYFFRHVCYILLKIN